MKKTSGYESVLGDPSVAETMKATMRGQQALAASPAKSSPARVAGPTKQAADVSVTGDPSVAAEMKDTQAREAAKKPAPLAKATPNPVKAVEKKAADEGGEKLPFRYRHPKLHGAITGALGGMAGGALGGAGVKHIATKMGDSLPRSYIPAVAVAGGLYGAAGGALGATRFGKKIGVARREKLIGRLQKQQTEEKAHLARTEKPKTASLDDKFAADLHQAVGIDVPSADADWQRPDVRVADQTNDRIDDHYLAWMREQADKDVVKESADLGELLGKAHEAYKHGLVGGKKAADAAARQVLKSKLRMEQLKGGAKALGGAAALGGATYGGYRLAKRRQKAAAVETPDTGVHAGAGVEKQAGVIENPENLALIDRIRKQSEKLFA
jgi:hypothetical protein